MWEKTFCSLLFFVIYNHSFWLENYFDILPDNLAIIEEKKLKKTKPKNKNSDINFSLILTKNISEILQEDGQKNKFITNIINLINQDDFGFTVLPQDLEKAMYQFSIWQQESEKFETLISQNSSSWNKTLITTKSLLSVIYLELYEFEKTQDSFIINKFVAKYLKISQDYLDSKNISLIHAIITKIYPSFDLNIEKIE